MKKIDVVQTILKHRWGALGRRTTSLAFASTNIALSKYWGKRDLDINLPFTSSISISLGNKGTTTELSLIDHDTDVITMNDAPIALTSSFGERLLDFLNLFRPKGAHFNIKSRANVPVAAGLASSASGFASIVLALNQLFDWQLGLNELSILARLGSGSACRSFWPGFVEWQAGVRADGMDSLGKPMVADWPDLRIGLFIINENEKSMSSRDAMQHTVLTSPFYTRWTEIAEMDCINIKKAVHTADFNWLGKTAEANALAMHSTLLASRPALSYYAPETIAAIQTIWKLRQQGLNIYFTQDAGPNLKLFFLRPDVEAVSRIFPGLEVIHLF